MELSACIIAKDEENNLPRLLKSLKGKFDEIILVDTGSIDRTIEVAREYGCKVYEKEWTGFANARNFAVSKATGDWVWHFDADFEIDDEEFKKAKQHLLILDDRFNSVEVIIENYNIDGTVRAYSSHTFIHRNKPDIKWVGKVHEWIQNGELVFALNVKVKHFGFEDYEVLKGKAKRNIKLLEEEIKDLKRRGEDNSQVAYKYFYLVQSYAVLSGDNKEYTERVVKTVRNYFSLRPNSDRKNIFDIHIFTYLMEALLFLKKYDECKEYLEKALDLNPDYPDFLFYKGKLFEKIGKHSAAFKGYVEFLFCVDKLHMKSPFESYNGLTVLSEKMVRSYNIALEIVPELFDKLENKAESISFVERKWKESRGLYTGIAYGKLLDKKGENPEKILRKLSRIYDKNYVAQFEYGKFLLMKNRIVEAQRFLKKVMELNPEFSMGKVLFLYAGVLSGKIDVATFVKVTAELKKKLEKIKHPYFSTLLSKCVETLNKVQNSG